MNANRRRKVNELKAQGLSPKEAYIVVKGLKLRGNRKP